MKTKEQIDSEIQGLANNARSITGTDQASAKQLQSVIRSIEFRKSALLILISLDAESITTQHKKCTDHLERYKLACQDPRLIPMPKTMKRQALDDLKNKYNPDNLRHQLDILDYLLN